MLSTVKPEAYIENPEKLIPNNTDVVGEIVNALMPKRMSSVDENGHCCDNCLHRDSAIDSEPCRSCVGLNRWEDKNVN